jgi:hypothetical protein
MRRYAAHRRHREADPKTVPDVGQDVAEPSPRKLKLGYIVASGPDFFHGILTW